MEMSHLSKISISIFSHRFLITSKCFILMQTSLQLDFWSQSYEGFVNAKNNIKRRNLNAVFSSSSISIFIHLYLELVAGKENIQNITYITLTLNTVFANISKTTSPTSDSFLLIMSHNVIILSPPLLSSWHLSFICPFRKIKFTI